MHGCSLLAGGVPGAGGGAGGLVAAGLVVGGRCAAGLVWASGKLGLVAWLVTGVHKPPDLLLGEGHRGGWVTDMCPVGLSAGWFPWFSSMLVERSGFSPGLAG